MATSMGETARFAIGVGKELERREFHARCAAEDAEAGGGLPSEEDIATLEETLDAACNALEQLAMRVEGIAGAPDGALSQPVTLEDIGAVAVVVERVRMRGGEILEFADRIEGWIGALDHHRVAGGSEMG